MIICIKNQELKIFWFFSLCGLLKRKGLHRPSLMFYMTQIFDTIIEKWHPRIGRIDRKFIHWCWIRMSAALISYTQSGPSALSLTCQSWGPRWGGSESPNLPLYFRSISLLPNRCSRIFSKQSKASIYLERKHNIRFPKNSRRISRER